MSESFDDEYGPTMSVIREMIHQIDENDLEIHEAVEIIISIIISVGMWSKHPDDLIKVIMNKLEIILNDGEFDQFVTYCMDTSNE